MLQNQHSQHNNMSPHVGWNICVQTSNIHNIQSCICANVNMAASPYMHTYLDAWEGCVRNGTGHGCNRGCSEKEEFHDSRYSTDIGSPHSSTTSAIRATASASLLKTSQHNNTTTWVGGGNIQTQHGVGLGVTEKGWGEQKRLTHNGITHRKGRILPTLDDEMRVHLGRGFSHAA